MSHLRSKALYAIGLVFALLVGWFAAIWRTSPTAVWRERLDTKSIGKYRIWVERQIPYRPVNATLNVYYHTNGQPKDSGTILCTVEDSSSYARLGVTAGDSVGLLAGSGTIGHIVNLGPTEDLSDAAGRAHSSKDTVVNEAFLDMFCTDAAYANGFMDFVGGPEGRSRTNAYVPDVSTAMDLAQVIWESEFRDYMAEYGVRREEWKPIFARLEDDSVWVVVGNLRAGREGGDLIAWISKADGRVLGAVLEK